MIAFPFNHQPVATVQDSSTSYTVPSGKYARATITLNVNAYVTTQTTNNNSDRFFYQQDSNSATISVWLAEGDVLSKSTSAASDSLTTVTSINTHDDGSVQSVASVSVNNGGGAVKISEIRARCTALIQSGDTTVDSLTISGNADVNWHIEEYNELT